MEGTVKDPVSIRFSNASGYDRNQATIGQDNGINYSVFQGDVQKGSGTLDASNTTIDLGNVKVDLKEGYEVDVNSEDGSAQTELYLAPTAYYQGDTRNKPGVEIKNKKGINVEPLKGSFDSDVQVKVTNSNNVWLGDGNNIKYQYSLDGGNNWTGTMEAENTSSQPELDLPGGRVRLSYAGTNNITAPNLKFELSGDAVVQSKKGVNMTTDPTETFDNKTMIKVTNNPTDIGDSIDYQYMSYNESTESWSGWSTEVTETGPELENNFDNSGGDDETVTLRSQGDINEIENGSTFVVDDSNNTAKRVPNVHSVAQGNFDQNIQVRIDDRDPSTEAPDSTTLGDSDQNIRYSYSTDGGETWTTGNEINQKSGNDYQDLVVPGGMLKLAPTEETGGGTSKLNVGDQFTIQPRNAGHGLEVSQGNEVEINNIGPDVFGGHYKNESGIEPAFEKNQQKNLFLGLGKLMTSLKNNDQEDISKSIGYVDNAIQQVSERLADVGARMNRSKAAENMLSELKTSQKERKSEIEDVDYAKLMSQLKQQNTVYQTILKSSSMIMRTSLVDYV